MPLILASLVFAVALAALPSTEAPDAEEVEQYEKYLASVRGKRRRSSGFDCGPNSGSGSGLAQKHDAKEVVAQLHQHNAVKRSEEFREKRLRRSRSAVLPLEHEHEVSPEDFRRGRSRVITPSAVSIVQSTAVPSYDEYIPSSSSSFITDDSRPTHFRRSSSVPSSLNLSRDNSPIGSPSLSARNL